MTASASTAGAASSEDRQGFVLIAITATTVVAAPVTISTVFRTRCDGGGLIENDRARAAWRVDRWNPRVTRRSPFAREGPTLRARRAASAAWKAARRSSRRTRRSLTRRNGLLDASLVYRASSVFTEPTPIISQRRQRALPNRSPYHQPPARSE